MALEDFERELAQEKDGRHGQKRGRTPSPDGDRHKKRHHHRSHHSSRQHDDRDRDHHSSRHDHKSHRHRGRDEEDRSRKSRHHRREEKTSEDDDHVTEAQNDQADAAAKPQRDGWMVAPSEIDVDYVHRRKQKEPASTFVPASKPADQRALHTLPELEEQSQAPTALGDLPAQHDVDYVFGDSGSSWRMTRLKAAYKKAEESGQPVEDIAMKQYGNLRDFDDAREEERELQRRRTHGRNYVGIEKPSGELFEERKLAERRKRPTEPEPESAPADESEDEFEAALGEKIREKSPPRQTVPLDQTALNKLKAQLMKAKISKAANYEQLKAEYEEAQSLTSKGPTSNVVVLNKMESRALAGGRGGEVQAMDNTKRGRERGHVKEKEDMSIEDMVRQERRTKHNSDGKAFAERIASDAKFTDDLDYLDENATKLSKSVQKSDINLRNVAVNEYQKMKRVLDSCPLCSHEDTGAPPQAPVVSLATRTYMTLPTSPEITPYGYCATIVPIEHRFNLLECDEDEWEEIRNFMKSLTRFYYSLKPRRHVIFYENAAHQGRKRHASLEAIPLPMKYADTASQFFKESILASDEEWTQHKKLINTLQRAEDGAGKLAFQRSMVSDLPYFHVWFRLDGGYGHVVEDERRWPKGDLFAREIIGGMLDVPPDVIKRQGRWRKDDGEMRDRVKLFREHWENFDWTKVLQEQQ